MMLTICNEDCSVISGLHSKKPAQPPFPAALARVVHLRRCGNCCAVCSAPALRTTEHAVCRPCARIRRQRRDMTQLCGCSQPSRRSWRCCQWLRCSQTPLRQRTRQMGSLPVALGQRATWVNSGMIIPIQLLLDTLLSFDGSDPATPLACSGGTITDTYSYLLQKPSASVCSTNFAQTETATWVSGLCRSDTPAAGVPAAADRGGAAAVRDRRLALCHVRAAANSSRAQHPASVRRCVRCRAAACICICGCKRPCFWLSFCTRSGVRHRRAVRRVWQWRQCRGRQRRAGRAAGADG